MTVLDQIIIFFPNDNLLYILTTDKTHDVKNLKPNHYIFSLIISHSVYLCKEN